MRDPQAVWHWQSPVALQRRSSCHDLESKAPSQHPHVAQHWAAELLCSLAGAVPQLIEAIFEFYIQHAGGVNVGHLLSPRAAAP